jgi:integrase/recombinase XerD
MPDQQLLGPWVRRFLLEHLIRERNLSRNTQQSYRDTLRLLIPFVTHHRRGAIDRLTVTDVSADLVRLFLTHLEEARHSSVVTRNQRLAAIHALARFIGERSPEHLDWCSQIRAIPFKRSTKQLIPYLEKPEMDAILAAVDRTTAQGRRDYALLLFLYNSGVRADEAAQLTIAELDFTPTRWKGQAYVRIHGKGHKIRQCPLWPVTMEALTPLLASRGPESRVFLNRRRQPLTRFGIHAVVKRYSRKAATTMSSLTSKRISPHTIRHSTATHLLRAGVDINTIRAWLGHVSISTTNIYAEIDLETKAKALATCELADAPRHRGRSWHRNPSLMDFLQAL